MWIIINNRKYVIIYRSFENGGNCSDYNKIMVRKNSHFWFTRWNRTISKDTYHICG